MYPRSVLCNYKKIYHIFDLKYDFYSLKIAAYCILLKECLHSFASVSEIDPGF